MYVYIYIYIYIYTFCARAPPRRGVAGPAEALSSRAKNLDFGGSDPSRLLIFEG